MHYGTIEMKRIHESEISPKRVDGSKGTVDVFDIITDPLTAGVRVVAPNSDVPAKVHSHSESQIIYMIEGTAKITNGSDILELRPGDFVVLEPYEEHYIQTKDKEAKIFEIKY